MGREWARIGSLARYATAHGLALPEMCAALGVPVGRVAEWAERPERGAADPGARVINAALQRALTGCDACRQASRACDSCRMQLRKAIAAERRPPTARQAPAVDPDAKCPICFARRCKRHAT